MDRMRASLSCTGFSLMELLVTVSILAILAGVAVPSYQSLIQRNLVKANTQAFFGSLVNARSEAVKNNQPTSICKSGDQTSCTSSGTWEQGWVVYIDANANGSFDNATESLLEGHPAMQSMTLRPSDTSINQLTYQADGTINSAATFNLCIDNDTTKGALITLGLTGRPSIEQGAKQCP